MKYGEDLTDQCDKRGRGEISRHGGNVNEV